MQTAMDALPEPAQEHVDSLHPHLQRAMGEQILRLSHLDFYDLEDEAEDPYPDPDKSYDPKRIETVEDAESHQDTIGQYMNRAAEALHRAHDTLVGQGTNDFDLTAERVTATALEQLIDKAVVEKRADAPEHAVASIETALVIQSFAERTDPKSEEETLVHRAVSRGLADQVVQASHNTYGLVHVVEEEPSQVRFTPVNYPGKQHESILHVASNLDFDEVFSEVQPITDEEEKEMTRSMFVHNLNRRDLLSLAEDALNHNNKSDAQHYVNEGLRLSAHPPRNAETLTKLITHAHDLELPGRQYPMAYLRTERHVGLEGTATHASRVIDQTVTHLLEQGQEDLAWELMSSHAHEPERLQQAIVERYGEGQKADEMIDLVKNLHERKQHALAVTLQTHGASEAAIQDALTTLPDPDMASTLFESDWQNYNRLEDRTEKLKFLAARIYPGKQATAAMALKFHDIAVDTPGIVERTAKLETIDAQLEYAQHIKTLWTHLEGVAATPALAEQVATAKEHLTHFGNPEEAFQGAALLYGEAYLTGIADFEKICKVKGASMVEVPKDFAQALVPIQDQLPDELFTLVAHNIRLQEHPTERAKVISHSFERAGTLMHNPELLLNILKDEYPKALVDRYIRTGIALQKEGESVDTVGPIAFDRISAEINKLDPEAFKIYVDNARWANEAAAIVRPAWTAQMEGKQPPETHATSLEDMPHIEAQFARLGIHPDTASAMLESWMTYDALRRARFIQEKTGAPIDLDVALDDQGNQIAMQLRSLSHHIETYGLPEALTIIDTFGIYNFLRYPPDQLHNQLADWQNGDVLPQNVVISARTDHNGALSESATSYQEQLGTEGLFFFEAGSQADLAKVAIAIGQREKQAGRNPKENTSLKNIIIGAHGHRTGLSLGPHGEQLEVNDYLLASRKRDRLSHARTNTFQQHLGNNYRLILHACRTAGKGGIADAMEIVHGADVEAFPDLVYGVRIEPNGDVLYQTTSDGDEFLPGVSYRRAVRSIRAGQA